MLLNKKANTYTFDFVRKIHLALDKVEANVGATSLITTSLHPTVFSGGLDLNFLTVIIFI
jgi:enoyl-CoA hydratase/carnithine racemase